MPGSSQMRGFPFRPPFRALVAAALIVLAGVAVARYVAGVRTPAQGAPVVVAFGDSLTEGNGSISHPWPAVLAERLARQTDAGGLQVLNAGISGNRLLQDDFGVSGL